MLFSSLALAAIVPFISSVSAECEISKSIPVDEVDYDLGSSDLCTKQAKGVYTFSMTSSLTVFPTFDSADVWAGKSQGTAFLLFDNNCNVKGIYARPSCEIPFWLDSQWLDYDVKVTSINTDPASSRYRFAYGSGSYGNGENDCHCKSKHRSLSSYSECRCPFPYNGDGSKI